MTTKTNNKDNLNIEITPSELARLKISVASALIVFKEQTEKDEQEIENLRKLFIELNKY
jgi:DUF4097 and DUF4098 domain-containing protein YvlB